MKKRRDGVRNEKIKKRNKRGSKKWKNEKKKQERK